MLLEMLPEQVANAWGILERLIGNALPPLAERSERKMNNILTSLLLGKATCWMSYKEPNEVDTIVVTMIVVDDLSDTKSLLIYCANALKIMDGDVYEGIIKTLSKYAKGKGCEKIVGYISNPKLIKMVEKYGGDCSYQLMTFELEG
jgi:hypothetical protein